MLSQLVSLAYAEEALESDSRQMTQVQAQAALQRIEQRVATADTATEHELKALQQEIATVRSAAQDCVQTQEPKIELLDSQLAILQPQETTGTHQSLRRKRNPPNK